LRDGFNRQEFVKSIVAVPGTLPSFGLVPDYMPGFKEGQTYRQAAPVPQVDNNKAVAKELIGNYLAQSKQSKVPAFNLLAGDTSRAKKFSEYLQQSFAKLYGTSVKIESVPFKTRLQRSRDGQFDAQFGGWCPDYRDAMTFMDLFTTKNGNNHSGWSNAKFDSLIEKANDEGDLKKRVAFLAEAEKILVEDAPAVFTDQDASVYVTSDGLEGVRRSAFGPDIDLRYASWSKEIARR